MKTKTVRIYIDDLQSLDYIRKLIVKNNPDMKESDLTNAKVIHRMIIISERVLI